MRRAVVPRWSVVLAWCLIAGGCANTDREKSYLLRHASVTLPEAARIAETQVPGRAVRAELIHKGNRVFYDVEVVDVFNKNRNIRVDAETGKVM